VPDPVLLFRYSALTFNGHRIHYDRSYVTEVEGYPG
jgi:3-methylfumaryl-CoA hydratase